MVAGCIDHLALVVAKPDFSSNLSTTALWLKLPFDTFHLIEGGCLTFFRLRVEICLWDFLLTIHFMKMGVLELPFVS